MWEIGKLKKINKYMPKRLKIGKELQATCKAV